MVGNTKGTRNLAELAARTRHGALIVAIKTTQDTRETGDARLRHRLGNKSVNRYPTTDRQINTYCTKAKMTQKEPKIAEGNMRGSGHHVQNTPVVLKRTENRRDWFRGLEECA